MRLLLILLVIITGLFNTYFYSFNVENVYNGINFYRVFNQIDKLQIDKGLEASARNKAADLCENNYFDHDNENTKWQSFLPKGSKNIGENLAKGYDYSFDVVLAWMKSNRHRDNLLDWEFKRVGIAIEPCNGKKIVVAHFSN